MAGYQFRKILCVTLLVLVMEFWMTGMNVVTNKWNYNVNLLAHLPKSKRNSLAFLPTRLGLCLENLSVKYFQM